MRRKPVPGDFLTGVRSGSLVPRGEKTFMELAAKIRLTGVKLLQLQERIMDRREMLFALGAAAVSASALPGNSQEMSMSHHHPMSGAKNQMLIDAASGCSSAAELCTSHCVEMLAEGDKTLAACAASSRETAVVCNGLRSLAAQNSAHLASYAKLAAEICKSCEAECRKHPQHETCKNCAEACAACAVECGKVA